MSSASLGDGPITRLNLDGDRITLEVSDGNPPRPATLEAGSLQRVLARLRHQPATPEELEAAISDIEDDLMPVIRLLPTQSCLVTSAPQVWRIARIAGLDDASDARLQIATVEALFNRLADVAYGTPPETLAMPADRAFAATLLLVRELLHHGGFASILVLR